MALPSGADGRRLVRRSQFARFRIDGARQQGTNALVNGNIPQRLGSSHPNIAPYGDLLHRDGHIVLAVGSDNQFKGLCEVLGLSDIVQRPEFSSNAARVEHEMP